MMLPVLRKCLYALSFSFLLFTADAGLAQGPDYGSDRVMFVTIEGLDADSYGAIATALKGNDEISIRVSCVPAEMIMFDINDDSDESLEDLFQQIKSITMAETDLNEVKIIAEYTEEAFNQRCAKFRIGAPVEE